MRTVVFLFVGFVLTALVSCDSKPSYLMKVTDEFHKVEEIPHSIEDGYNMKLYITNENYFNSESWLELSFNDTLIYRGRLKSEVGILVPFSMRESIIRPTLKISDNKKLCYVGAKKIEAFILSPEEFKNIYVSFLNGEEGGDAYLIANCER